MSDEIKEILDNTLEYLEGIDETRNTKILTTNETNILLDYITNLQERNEKAIEYIKETSFFNKSHYDFKNDLLNILQGSDNNE